MPHLVKGNIAYTIHHFSDARHVRYSALSYHWGDPSPTHAIYLGESPSQMHLQPLHGSLWNFLYSVWQNKMTSTYIWVDALCLDQSNAKEVSQQVSRMGDIYAEAEEVIIWLGDLEAERESRPAMTPPEDMEGRLTVREEMIYWMEKVPDLFLPYWERSWIIQEFARARRICVALNGEYLTLDDYLNHYIRSDYVLHPPAQKGRRHMLHKLREVRDANTKLPLWQLVLQFQRARATKPADRVYGLLGLAAPNPNGTSPAKLLEVDCEKEPSEVFWDAAFESRAPWNQQDRVVGALQHMLDQDPRSATDTLGAYAVATRTSARHARCARITLQVCRAFSFMMERFGAEMCLSTSSEDFKAVRPRSAYLSAALVGWAISLHKVDEAMHSSEWRGIRGSAGESSSDNDPSPWFCPVHKPQNDTVAQDWQQLVFRATFAPGRYFNLLRTWKLACHDHDSSPSQCGGGQLAFEAPEAGLRVILLVGKGDESWGHLKQHFLIVQIKKTHIASEKSPFT